MCKVIINLKVAEISDCMQVALNAYAADGREADLIMARKLFWIGLDLARLANKMSSSAATEEPKIKKECKTL